jgi:phosphate transport system protein
MAAKRHTDKTFDRDLDELRTKLVTLCAKVENEAALAMQALVSRDSDLAATVRVLDREVNRLEVDIDQACRRLLALRQPAASDLRLITTALKIDVDLERMGDLAVGIAERVIELNDSPPLAPLPEVVQLGELAQQQLRRALDAFIDGDASMAEQVIRDDAFLDALYAKVFNNCLGYMMEDPRNLRRFTSLLFIAKHLERFGDHATNVAEMVIYMVRGTDVRHPYSRHELLAVK